MNNILTKCPFCSSDLILGRKPVDQNLLRQYIASNNYFALYCDCRKFKQDSSTHYHSYKKSYLGNKMRYFWTIIYNDLESTAFGLQFDFVAGKTDLIRLIGFMSPKSIVSVNQIFDFNFDDLNEINKLVSRLNKFSLFQ